MGAVLGDSPVDAGTNVGPGNTMATAPGVPHNATVLVSRWWAAASRSRLSLLPNCRRRWLLRAAGIPTLTRQWSRCRQPSRARAMRYDAWHKALEQSSWRACPALTLYASMGIGRHAKGSRGGGGRSRGWLRVPRPPNRPPNPRRAPRVPQGPRIPLLKVLLQSYRLKPYVFLNLQLIKLINVNIQLIQLI